MSCVCAETVKDLCEMYLKLQIVKTNRKLQACLNRKKCAQQRSAIFAELAKRPDSFRPRPEATVPQPRREAVPQRRRRPQPLGVRQRVRQAQPRPLPIGGRDGDWGRVGEWGEQQEDQPDDQPDDIPEDRRVVVIDRGGEPDAEVIIRGLYRFLENPGDRTQRERDNFVFGAFEDLQNIKLDVGLTDDQENWIQEISDMYINRGGDADEPDPEPAEEDAPRGLLERDPGRVDIPIGDQIIREQPENWGPLPSEDQIPQDRDRVKRVTTTDGTHNFGWVWTRSSEDPQGTGGWRKNLMYGRRMGQAPGTGRRARPRPAVYGDEERRRMEKRHLR